MMNEREIEQTVPEVLDPPDQPRGRRRWLGALGTVALTGAILSGGFALVQAGGGASSPEGAVQRLADAISAEDVAAMMSSLSPEEVRSLPETYTAVLGALDQFGVDVAEEDPTQGADVAITGLELEVEDLSDQVAKVNIVGGELSWKVDGESTFGSAIEGMFGYDSFDETADPSIVSGGWTEGSIDLAEASAELLKDGGQGLFAMTVDHGDGWFVSPYFTIAEYARLSSGGADVDFSAGVLDAGADTPTAALEVALGKLESNDLDGFVGSLANELSVLQIYGPGLEGQWDTIFDGEDSVTFSDLTFREEPIDANRVRVVITGGHLEATTSSPLWEDDYFYDESESCFDDCVETIDEPAEPEVMLTTKVEMTLADGCVTYVEDGVEEEPKCFATVDGGVLRALGVDDLSVVAVRDPGREGWAVSPVESVLDYLRTAASNLNEDLVRRLQMETGFGIFFGPTEPSDESYAEPSSALGYGEHTVLLDSAGLAVVELDLDGAVAVVESDASVRAQMGPISDELLADPDTPEGELGDFEEVEDPYLDEMYPFAGSFSGNIYGDGAVMSISGAIGADSVEVSVIDPLDSAVPFDGSTQVREKLGLGEFAAYSIAPELWSDTVVESGWFLTSVAFGESGEVVEQGDVAEGPVTVVITSDYTDGKPEPGTGGRLGDDEFRISVPAPGTYFVGTTDPMASTVAFGGDEAYVTVPIQLDPAQPVTLVASGSGDTVDIDLYCESTFLESISIDSIQPERSARISPMDRERCDLELWADQPPLGAVTLSLIPG